jgi:hypothetical protein
VPSKTGENIVEIVNGQNLSHASVVVKRSVLRSVTRVEVPHAGLGAANKCSVAEDYPWFAARGGEWPPELR